MPKSTMEHPKITVVIPTYRREDVLINTIKGVLRQSFKELELIVVDQSLEHTKQTLNDLRELKKDKRFRYFKTSPPSVTAAKNFALKKARTPYAIFLDDDVELDKDLVKTHYQTFQKMPELSAIAGRVLQEGFPIKKDVLKFNEYGITHGVFTATHPGFTNAFPGGNCAVRVKDALAAGGFDTRYKGNAFREENDLSLRMHKLGQKIYFQPKASLLHLAAPSGGHRVKTHIYDNFGFYKNELFFTLRMVERKYLLTSLRLKYREYCFSARHFRAYRRRLFFVTSLIPALWRILFGRPVVAKEIKS